MGIDHSVAVYVGGGEYLYRLFHYGNGILVQLYPQLAYPVHAVLEGAYDVVYARDVGRVHAIVAVDVHRMPRQHRELVQVVPVYYPVAVDVGPHHRFGKISLDFSQEGEYVVELVHVLQGDKAVAVDVAFLEYLYQLAQPVHVVRRHPAVAVKIGYLFLVIRDTVRFVFDHLVDESKVVVIDEPVAVRVDVALHYLAQFFYVGLVYLAVRIEVVLRVFIQVYQFLFSEILVYGIKLLDIGLIDLIVPVDVEDMETVYQGPVVYCRALLQQVDVVLVHQPVAVDVGPVYVLRRDVHVKSLDYLREPCGVSRVHHPVVVKVFELLEHVKEEHLVRCGNRSIAVEVRHLYLFPGYDSVASRGELEHAFYVFHV